MANTGANTPLSHLRGLYRSPVFVTASPFKNQAIIQEQEEQEENHDEPFNADEHVPAKRRHRIQPQPFQIPAELLSKQENEAQIDKGSSQASMPPTRYDHYESSEITTETQPMVPYQHRKKPVAKQKVIASNTKVLQNCFFTQH